MRGFKAIQDQAMLRRDDNARRTHVAIVPLGPSEVRPGAFRRPENVPVVPEEPAEERVCHRAGGIWADVPQGQVRVTSAEETVRQPARSNEEPGPGRERSPG